MTIITPQEFLLYFHVAHAQFLQQIQHHQCHHHQQQQLQQWRRQQQQHQGVLRHHFLGVHQSPKVWKIMCKERLLGKTMKRVALVLILIFVYVCFLLAFWFWWFGVRFGQFFVLRPGSFSHVDGAILGIGVIPSTILLLDILHRRKLQLIIIFLRLIQIMQSFTRRKLSWKDC